MSAVPQDPQRHRNRAQGYRSILNPRTQQQYDRFKKYHILAKLLGEQYERMIKKMADDSPAAIAARKAWGLESEKQLRGKALEFKEGIWKSLGLAEDGVTDESGNYLFYKLRHAFIHGNVSGLAAELKFAFMNSVLQKQYSNQVASNQALLADIRYPMEWFPATRALQRTIHLHVGPTNSGKTYHALQKLEQAKTGIYAGPLRLLAHEVYTRLNANGKPCALITGEERRLPEGADSFMSSCTVEMVPLNTQVDVAVIDEIQMMGDLDRGWAWTQAFLGVMAKEVHLCGELRTVPLIKDICAALGDKLVIHKYKRLSPLQASKHSLRGDVKNLKKGDAVILFSRIQIHAMKKHIEEATGKRCAVVYGSLPPETRAQQANLFNDPDNDYDYLVASDAVGMGLNLSIKRIVFDTTWKFDGASFQPLAIPELKQIAGRAGRYRTARDATMKKPIDLTDGVPADVLSPSELAATKGSPPQGDTGNVTTFEQQDLQTVHDAMSKEPAPLKTANVLPPTAMLTRFASYFPSTTPFSYILLRLHDIATVGSCFKLCRLQDQIEISDLIQGSNLSIRDRIIFSAAPASLRDPGLPEIVQELAECVAQQSNGHILEIKSIPFELLDIKQEEYEGGASAYLRATETLHKAITMYLWLSYRFAGVFQSQALAFHLKDMVESKIDDALGKVSYDERRRRKLKSLQKKHAAQIQSGTSPEATIEKLERELAGEGGVDAPMTQEDPVGDSDGIDAPAGEEDPKAS